MRLTTPVLILFLCTFNYRASADIVDRFLKEVVENSSEVQIIQIRKSSKTVASNLALLRFDVMGNLSSSINHADPPATSPFTSNRTKLYQFSTGVQKLLTNGIELAANYNYANNFTGYKTRSDLLFQQTGIDLTASTYLFQNYLSDRFAATILQSAEEKKVASMESNIEREKVLKGALLTLAEILETADELRLQKRLCRRVNQQTRKLEQKNRRGSISKRDYLLSRKELNTCHATIAILTKELDEKREQLASTYSVSFDNYSNLKIDKLFLEVSSLFRAKEHQSIDAAENSDVRFLQAQSSILRLKGRGLNALTKNSLKLELKLGSEGLDKKLSEAHSDVAGLEYPYVSLGVSMDWPMENHEALINKSVNRYQQRVLQLQTQQLTREKGNRFKVLKSSLNQNFLIYENYKKNVQLSILILNEAQRDFNTGRIDFFKLSEFQKGLTQSRQLMANLRTQILILTVEFIDYFDFFKRYY